MSKLFECRLVVAPNHLPGDIVRGEDFAPGDLANLVAMRYLVPHVPTSTEAEAEAVQSDPKAG